MQNESTKITVNTLAGIVGAIIGGFIILGLMLRGGSPSHQAAGPPVPTQSASTYTRLICENAYSTEKHYDDKNIPYVDVDLVDKCFSGYIGLPKKWTGFQGQMLHPSSDDWVAEWFAGNYNPAGPYTAELINSMKMNPQQVTSSMNVRLQGKGKIRFYCITGCPEPSAATINEPAGLPQSSGPLVPDETPARQLAITKVLPMSGESGDLHVEIDQCEKLPPNHINCFGYIVNQSDNLGSFDVYRIKGTDDDGNTIDASGWNTRGSLMPGVRQKFIFKMNDDYQKVQSVNVECTIVWRNQGLTYAFKDIPVQ